MKKALIPGVARQDGAYLAEFLFGKGYGDNIGIRDLAMLAGKAVGCAGKGPGMAYGNFQAGLRG
jgi:hypothetical protein